MTTQPTYPHSRITTKQQTNIIKALVAEQTIKELDKIRPEIQHLAIASITQAMCITLHDKWDWSTDKLNILLLQMADTFDSVLKQYVTMEDIEQWCKENGITEML